MTRQKILIVNTAQDKEDISYALPIHTLLSSSDSRIVHYSDIKLLEDTNEYQAVILSGQPPSDTSHTKQSVETNYSWVKRLQVPTMGFCGGHQIIGLLYGAELISQKEAEPKGYFVAYGIPEHTEDPIFNGIHLGRCHSFVVYNKHYDSITLPENFTLLASTDRCENALMKHETKLIYGAQFHPEDPGYYSRSHGINQKSNQDSDTMLENFEKIVAWYTQNDT